VSEASSFIEGSRRNSTRYPRHQRRGFITHAPIGSLVGSPTSFSSLHCQSHRQGAYTTQMVERKYPHFPGLHFPAKIAFPFFLQCPFQVDLMDVAVLTEALLPSVGARPSTTGRLRFMNVVSVATAAPPPQPSSTASIPTTPSNRGLAIFVAATEVHR
jgi:hypothetical protein